MSIESLYIHFPFCEAKCHYCDFYSLGRDRTHPGDALKFEEALRREIQATAHLLSPQLDTVFMGGGTPSMTAPDSMIRSLGPLWDFTSIGLETEWTMEANPSSVSLKSLKAYRSLGVNRISLGVQTLNSDLLKALGRVHTHGAALEALEIIFSAGFENVSVDLLCGVPGQSIEDLKESLDTLLSFPITHLSCYLLTLPKHHPLFPRLPNEDIQLNHLLWVDSYMKKWGFEHYEISNYAKPGKRARHNLRYWKGSSYLGLGPSAHSFDAKEGKRWKNFSSLHRYSNFLEKGQRPVEWTENLTAEQRQLEQWMLALRLDEGFPLDWLAPSIRRTRAKSLEENGLLESHPTRAGYLRLTAQGFALSDQVIASLA